MMLETLTVRKKVIEYRSCWGRGESAISYLLSPCSSDEYTQVTDRLTVFSLAGLMDMPLKR